jgi:hypothetical protein
VFEQQAEEEIVFPVAAPARPLPHYPRWTVVSGVILYCSIFWVVVWFAGGWVLSLVHGGGVTP